MNVFRVEDFTDIDMNFQSIEVGPVKVDTGSDWMDFGFAVMLLIIMLVVAAWLKHTLNKDG